MKWFQFEGKLSSDGSAVLLSPFFLTPVPAMAFLEELPRPRMACGMRWVCQTKFAACM